VPPFLNSFRSHSGSRSKHSLQFLATAPNPPKKSSIYSRLSPPLIKPLPSKGFIILAHRKVELCAGVLQFISTKKHSFELTKANKSPFYFVALIMSCSAGTTFASNQGFFFCHILLRGEGCTSGKNWGRNSLWFITFSVNVGLKFSARLPGTYSKIQLHQKITPLFIFKRVIYYP
jgi:hypothetical protein